MDAEISDLEKEFTAACDESRPLIKEQLNIARAAVMKAIEISEQFGVPFSCSPSFVRNGYIPKSLSTKFSELDDNTVAEISEVWSEYGYDAGWTHSNTIC